MTREILSAAWHFYESHVVPDDAEADYRIGAQKAFYSGALIVIECVKSQIGVPDRGALANLQQLEREIRRFENEHRPTERNRDPIAS